MGAGAHPGEPQGDARWRDIFPLPPLPTTTFPCTSSSSRVRGHVRKLQRAHDLATSAIDALNSLYAAPIGSCRGRDPAAAPYSSRVAEVHKYIFDCCSEFAVAPASSDSSASHGFPLQEDEDEA